MKRTIVFLPVVLLALSVFGCKFLPLQPKPPEGSALETAGNSDKQITVRYAQIGTESDWRVATVNSMKDAARAEGWELLNQDASCSQERQFEWLREAIAKGDDYIVLAPIVKTGWDQVMSEARDVGIPVIMLETNIDMPDREDYYATWITLNFIQEGEKAGRWLTDYMEAEGRGNDEINIVELQGTVGSSPAIDRQTGFESIINNYPNYKITQSQTGDFETERGKEIMEAFLNEAASNSVKIDVLFAHSDGMAIGAIQAIKEAGLIPGEDIVIIGIDGSKLAFEAIAAGDMNVTIECSPIFAPIVLDVIKTLEAGEAVPKVIYINPGETAGIYDEYFYHNVISELPSRAY